MEGTKMAPMIYEASVYTQQISYRNFKGENKIANLHFALDPLQLLAALSAYTPKKIKSGNPALNGKEAEITEEEQIKMVRDLAQRSAGSPSEDGESWIPFEDFTDSIAGKAFLTKLVSSDQDRRDFSEKVILDPFRAFCAYFEADGSNSDKEVKEMNAMLAKVENVFKTPEPNSETPEDRKAKLLAQLAEIDDKTIPGVVVE
jgi:hypothetical protein